MKASKYDEIVSLAKRRGFFWPSFEIYGGVSGYYDIGPLGSLLLNNIVDLWREFFVQRHSEFIVEIKTPIVMPKEVFEASGHLEHFTDYMVRCTKCGRIYRADHLIEEATGISGLEGLGPEDLDRLISENDVRCPECGGELGKVEVFNLLMKTTIGPYTGNVAYARPEAAQGMFINFKRVYEQMGSRLPLGIAQIGRVMRNEISPRQGLIRVREFTIMELELFFDPEDPRCPLLDGVGDKVLNIIVEADAARHLWRPRTVTVREAIDRGMIKNEWNAYFMAVATEFLNELGVPTEKQVFIDKPEGERAHYAAQTFDQLVDLGDLGWVEVSGHAYRTDYDLKGHARRSGVDLRAYRRFREPIKVREVIVKVNKALLGRTYRERASHIMSRLSSMGDEEVARSLEERGYVEVDGLRLGRDFFYVTVRDRVVHGERFFPHVAEPSFGAERLLYTTINYAYTKRDGRVVLRIPRRLVPVQVAVYPLVARDGLDVKARDVFRLLREAGFRAIYDDTAFIGKLYAKGDEIGIPIAVTIDYDTMRDDTVTLRDRDTWRQVRAPINDLAELLRSYFNGEREFEELGVPFTSS